MRTDRTSRAWWCARAAALCLLSACPGKLDDKPSFLTYEAAHGDAGAGATDPDAASAGSTTSPDACGDVPTRIFLPSCAGTGCHSSAAPQQGLDLASPGVASRVVGVSGTMCPVTLADPTNPEVSLLYQKLAVKPPCGAQMPLARPALSAADAACVLKWIAAQ